MVNHIFNVKEIVRKSKTQEANKGEKVRQIFKGAVTGSPALLDELKSIITAGAKKACAELDKTKKELKKSAA